MPTWKPASKLSVFSKWRLTAAGSTRRSATSTPVELSPAIIARLIIRQPGGASRLQTTRSPRFIADRSPLLDEHMRADVAAPADDRALDHGAPADVSRGVDHAPTRPRLLAE